MCHRILRAVVLSAVPLLPAAVLANGPSTCEALTLYGNAANSGLCKSLTLASQNLWVCELTSAQPDVHLTVNAQTPLHVTVRTQTQCEGNANVTGRVAAPLGGGAVVSTLSLPANTAAICNVNVVNYGSRLGQVAIAAPVAPNTLCKQGFVNAKAKGGNISAATLKTYIAKCDAPAPAAAACP